MTLLSRPHPGWLAVLCLCLGATMSVARADAPVFRADHGKAVAGYDVVSYFTSEKPLPGDPTHAVLWKGVIWQFISRKNREKFEANPRAYAPQYGGYCAFGVSQGLVLKTDPMLYRIIDGKLYLLHDKAVWSRWVENVSEYIAEADTNWPAVLRDE
ncbi:YHS domain-containing (seleno)protein [Sedimentitalea sp. XS_ASV28]|uniref:YHS domain-containing (seleno)protein n=1 Tax=Sedimentitalea sp. XS_ASV28 TaxID=3241296 RepID=UPI003517F2A5